MDAGENEVLEPEEGEGEDSETETDAEEGEEAVEGERDPSEGVVETANEHFVVVDTPGQGDDFDYYPITFEGRVSTDTVKIQVIAHNGPGGYQDDYFLNDYVAGIPFFTYRAAPGWNNLGEGENFYNFIAHYADGSTNSFETSINYEAPQGRVAAIFDGCKSDIDGYTDRVWFHDLALKMGQRGLTVTDYYTGEACYADNAGTVIFLHNGDYCSSGTLYRYYTDTKALQAAHFVNDVGGCQATFGEFGKREGEIIPLSAEFGDAGCMAEVENEYNFITNEIVKVKSRSRCENEPFGAWDYYDRRSGKKL